MKGKPREGGSWIPLFVLGLLGLAFVGIGTLAWVQAGRVEAECGTLRGLPDFDGAALESPIPETAVVVTGVLQGQDAVADPNGLLLHVEEVWNLRWNDSEGSEGWEGDWERVLFRLPPCTVRAARGDVALAAAADVPFDGVPWEFVTRLPDGGREVDGVREGTVRRRGFKAGDRLTVVGVVQQAGIRPQRYFGGDRAGLEQHLSQQVLGLRLVGGVFSLVGLALAIAAGALWGRRRSGALRRAVR